MKRLFYFLVILILSSCNKNEPEPISSPGFIEGYLKDNQTVVSKTTESIPSSVTDFGIYRGYYIIPSKKIKITSIGAKIPEPGTYQIMILSGALYDFGNRNYMLMDSINISNINSFQYKAVSQELILSANDRYLIIYFNKNHNSVYKAQYPNYVTLPLTVNDIKIESLFYYYGVYYGGVYNLVSGNSIIGSVNGISGLVDFKYVLMQ